MKNKLFAVIFLLYVIIIISCTNQNSSVFIPVPGDDYYGQEKRINSENIIQTKDSYSAGVFIPAMPQWFIAYIKGGIAEVEKMEAYNDKYAFIGISEGINFSALGKWADNYSVKYDFTLLAASRIEKKMVTSASLYPDYEYGAFFDNMIKSAYSREYQGAVKEDTYWIKLKNNDNDLMESLLTEEQNLVTAPSEVYNYFVFIIIDKEIMQDHINNIIAGAVADVKPTGNQRNAINRLRQSFFEDF